MTLQLVTFTQATLFRKKKVTNIENETLTNCQLGDLDLGGTKLERPVSYIQLLYQTWLIFIRREEWRKMWLQVVLEFESG